MSAADQINELRGLRNAGGGIVRNILNFNEPQ